MAELLTLEERTNEGPGPLAWQGWTVGGATAVTPARTTAQAREGRSSLSFDTPLAGTSYSLELVRAVPLQAPGDPHTVRFSARRLNTTGGPLLYLYLYYLDVAQADMGAQDYRLMRPSAAGWRDAGAVFTPPAGARYVWPRIVVATSAGNVGDV